MVKRMVSKPGLDLGRMTNSRIETGPLSPIEGTRERDPRAGRHVRPREGRETPVPGGTWDRGSREKPLPPSLALGRPRSQEPSEVGAAGLSGSRPGDLRGGRRTGAGSPSGAIRGGRPRPYPSGGDRSWGAVPSGTGDSTEIPRHRAGRRSPGTPVPAGRLALMRRPCPQRAG